MVFLFPVLFEISRTGVGRKIKIFTFMKVINNTDSEIYMVFKGKRYEVEAHGSLGGVPVNVTEHWKRIHGFIIVENDNEMPSNASGSASANEKESEELPFSCPKCEDRFSTERGMKSHLGRVHAKKEVETPKDEPSEEGQTDGE